MAVSLIRSLPQEPHWSLSAAGEQGSTLEPEEGTLPSSCPGIPPAEREGTIERVAMGGKGLVPAA